MNPIEKRNLTDTELRVEPAAEGKPAKITGTAAVYGALSSPMATARGTKFRERVMPGAFGDLSNADIRGRYNHDLILGRTKSGTMKLTDTPAGLKYEITPPNSAAANHVVEGVNRGDIDGSSFAFRTIKDNWKSENGEAIRELHLIDPVDVGPVDMPAYKATADGSNAVAIRSIGGDVDERSIDEAVAKLNASPTPNRDAREHKRARLI